MCGGNTERSEGVGTGVAIGEFHQLLLHAHPPEGSLP